MDDKIKGYALLKDLLTHEDFKTMILSELKKGTIRFFEEEEWEKIRSQNFVSPITEIDTFEDMFIKGYNIGNCVGASRQLSYSYQNVDIVSGVLPILKGTRNAEKEGGHCWLETPTSIIDTSLMLVINKSLKEQIGYIEEQRITSTQLAFMPNYQARKEFVNDKNIKGKRSYK